MEAQLDWNNTDMQFYVNAMKIDGGSIAQKKALMSKMSLEIYEAMNILIGNKELIQTRRLIVHSRYKVMKIIGIHAIPSGSKAEGLDMPGSDVDVMISNDGLRVYTLDLPNIALSNEEVFLYANTLDTTLQPGFVIIHVFGCSSRKCIGILGSSDFLSEYIRPRLLYLSKPFSYQKHGPCMSNYSEETDLDIAYCLPSNDWPLVGQEWPERKRCHNWPNPTLIQRILNDGCLFVPIGYEANSDSDTDWRISFSKAEKRLVFSFNHVQMLIYGLLKLVLKEVINTESSVDGLLCSYFMKTILFWAIEESPSTLWVPTHFMLCFWLCFTRLFSFIENKTYPHYFMKHVYLFQRKITNEARTKLLKALQPLKHTGIHFIYRSQTIKKMLSTKAEKTSAAHCQRQLDITKMNAICYTKRMIYGMEEVYDRPKSIIAKVLVSENSYGRPFSFI